MTFAIVNPNSEPPLLEFSGSTAG